MKLKLITEMVEDVQYITEESEGKKSFFIEGPFMQANIKNRNGRFYPDHILERECNRYIKESINENRAFGELGHPDNPSINLHLVSHMIKSLKREGNDFIGRAKVLDTPNGMIVQNLIKEGAKLGVSSRGLGTVTEKAHGKEVQEDFYLATPADIVADPSAPAAFVNGIMEGREFWFENGNWKIAEQSQAILRKATIREIEEKAPALFERFLATLVKK